MLTILALALWLGGLIAMLAGHLLIGALVAAAGYFVSAKALDRTDDMETAAGLAFGFVLLVGAAAGLQTLWRWFTA